VVHSIEERVGNKLQRLGFVKNVASAAKARQKWAKNRSLLVVNEDFEPIFNAGFASAAVFQRRAMAPFMTPS
jgi:hypothetical protein